MGYHIVNEAPSVAEYLEIRRLAGLGRKSVAAAEAGLARSLFALKVVHEGAAVGMGRVVGDGGCFLQVVDVAVVPAHQGHGVGTTIMRAITDYLQDHMLPGAYVSLVTDKPDFYRGFGFQRAGPPDEALCLWRPAD